MALSSALFDHGGVARQLVGDGPSRRGALALQQPAEESNSGPAIAPWLDEDVAHITILVDRPPQVLLPPLDPDEQLIEMPRVSLTATAASQLLGVLAPEDEAPLPEVSYVTVAARSARISSTSQGVPMDDELGQEMRRPRWGTYSTKGHLDKASLTIDLLLYDKLVFPKPRPDAVGDWQKTGWDPKAQETLLGKLGDDLACTATWEGALQDEFRRDYPKAERKALEVLSQEGPQEGEQSDLKSIAQEMAYAQTALKLAAVAHEDPTLIMREPVPPVAIAAFQSEEQAKAAYALRRVDHLAYAENVRSEVEREFTALFTRDLAVPSLDQMALDEAFDRVVALAKTEDYRQARRALYDWEQRVVREGWPIDAASKELIRRSREHDALVRKAFRNCWTQRKICVAAVVVPQAAALAGGLPGFLVGCAAAGLMKFAESKAPKIKEPTSQPGAALAMAVDAVWQTSG